jgi:hypothetical protein
LYFVADTTRDHTNIIIVTINNWTSKTRETVAFFEEIHFVTMRYPGAEIRLV